MDINFEEHLNSTYFSTIDENFLGNKKFELKLFSASQEYNFQVQASQNYKFPSKKPADKPIQIPRSFVASQSFNIDKFNVQNSLRPYEDELLVNSLTYDTGKYGQVMFTQKSSKTTPLSSLSLRHIIAHQGIESKTDFGYSYKDSVTLSNFINYSSKTSIFTNYLSNPFEHTFGSLFKASVLDLKIRNFSFYLFLKYSKYNFLFAHSSDQPTFDNFFDVFTLGIEKRTDPNNSLLLKLRHDYRKKETQIDLLKEMKITENASFTNKVTSNYYIGTSLTYKFNPNIKISHCSEIDLKKFFKEEENYKYGVRVDITL